VGQGEPRVAKRSVFVINIRGGAILGWIQILELIYINHSRIPALLAKYQFFYTYLLEEKIIQPTIQGLQKDKLTYKGIVYFGLIKVGDEPMVIEYNCRLGDPETEVILPRLQNDFVALAQATLAGNLADQIIIEDERACCTVVLASKGYPEAFEKNKIITGIHPSNQQSLVFFAGVKKVEEQWLTSGGRVLMLSSLGATLQEALTHSLSAADAIQFDNKYYRKDIGFEFL